MQNKVQSSLARCQPVWPGVYCLVPGLLSGPVPSSLAWHGLAISKDAMYVQSGPVPSSLARCLLSGPVPSSLARCRPWPVWPCPVQSGPVQPGLAQSGLAPSGHFKRRYVRPVPASLARCCPVWPGTVWPFQKTLCTSAEYFQPSLNTHKYHKI